MGQGPSVRKIAAAISKVSRARKEAAHPRSVGALLDALETEARGRAEIAGISWPRVPESGWFEAAAWQLDRVLRRPELRGGKHAAGRTVAIDAQAALVQCQAVRACREFREQGNLDAALLAFSLVYRAREQGARTWERGRPRIAGAKGISGRGEERDEAERERQRRAGIQNPHVGPNTDRERLKEYQRLRGIAESEALKQGLRRPKMGPVWKELGRQWRCLPDAANKRARRLERQYE